MIVVAADDPSQFRGANPLKGSAPVACEKASCRLLKRASSEARDKSTSGGVHRQYVDARRLSATKPMGLFQQPATPKSYPAEADRQDPQR
jgi:hypothetical protein